jgi:hypothetical protein
MSPLRPYLIPSLPLLLLAGAAGCSGSDNKAAEPPGGDPAGVSDSYTALSAGRISELPDLIRTLDESLERDPDDGRANLYAATMRFWRIAENGPGMGSFQDEARAVLDHFDGAYEGLPDDARIPAFSGLAHTFLGGLLGDTARADRGKMLLQEGVERMPTYGHFLRALSTGSLPASDPAYATTLEHMYADAEACEWKSDGADGYVYPDEPLAYPYQVCNNHGIVPHVWEGFFTAFGDFALKGGLGAEKARALYSSAKGSPTYDSWQYADELQKRIDGAEAAAALYADDDAKNDPGVWTLSGHICTGCHQK